MKRCPKCLWLLQRSSFTLVKVKGKLYPRYCRPCDARNQVRLKWRRTIAQWERCATDAAYAHAYALDENRRWSRRHDSAERARRYAREWAARNARRKTEIQVAYLRRRERRDPQFKAKQDARRIKWRNQHRGRLRLLANARRSRELAAAGHCTEQQLADRIAYWGHRCWMCGGPYESIDHVIALSRGGTNWPANLRPACRHCNSSKHAKPYQVMNPVRL